MKIVALNGLLGYGYSEEALEIAFSEKVDYLGVDAGSTDPGPYYLGSGKSFTDRGAVKRDLSLALPKALEHKAPFIIGTAGGAGSIKVEAGAAGKIFKIEAKVGQAVKKGDAVVILEAMKMEIPVVAPADGTVASIDVAVGDAIEAGAVLATLN